VAGSLSLDLATVVEPAPEVAEALFAHIQGQMAYPAKVFCLVRLLWPFLPPTV